MRKSPNVFSNKRKAPISPMATITKRELAIRITDQLGSKGLELTQQEVLEVVQTLIEEITESLAQGDTVVMRNFGAFEVREMKAKIGRNPKDPTKDVPIPARAAVKFKPGKEMKEKVATTLQIIRERSN
ncbi:MAG: HU family DNA-binding protein [Verrucomicrobiales bacterium]|nr:HU family DNA-binding protein [Verrucomicrobiota bacterium JB025]